MSEQATVVHDLHTLLTESGPDAFALTWVAGADTDPLRWLPTPPLAAGMSGAALPGFDHARLSMEEVTRGPQETLHRWTQLDDGQRHLAILSSDLGVLREHTPGELAAILLHDPRTDPARVNHLLSRWFGRRIAQAPLAQELAWVTAAAAWTSHMSAPTWP